jgi:hypothetical protein
MLLCSSLLFYSSPASPPLRPTPRYENVTVGNQSHPRPRSSAEEEATAVDLEEDDGRVREDGEARCGNQRTPEAAAG